jgi:hypothetical protein
MAVVKPKQNVLVKMWSSAIDFSDAQSCTVSEEVVSLNFLGKPIDTCVPGRHPALFTICEKESENVLDSIAFELQTVDFAFDHISRPLLSNVS